MCYLYGKQDSRTDFQPGSNQNNIYTIGKPKYQEITDQETLEEYRSAGYSFDRLYKVNRAFFIARKEIIIPDFIKKENIEETTKDTRIGLVTYKGIKKAPKDYLGTLILQSRGRKFIDKNDRETLINEVVNREEKEENRKSGETYKRLGKARALYKNTSQSDEKSKSEEIASVNQENKQWAKREMPQKKWGLDIDLFHNDSFRYFGEKGKYFSDKGLTHASSFDSYINNHKTNITHQLYLHIKVYTPDPFTVDLNRQISPTTGKPTYNFDNDTEPFHSLAYLGYSLTKKLPKIDLTAGIEAGIDSPNLVGHTFQNTWHDIIGVPHFPHPERIEPYIQLKGAMGLDKDLGKGFSFRLEPNINVGTHTNSTGVKFKLELKEPKEFIKAFVEANADIGLSKLYSKNNSLEPMYNALGKVGIVWSPFKPWAKRRISFGHEIVFDYNSVAKNDLSTIRVSFLKIIIDFN